jgi:hypothetical protein
VIGILKDTAPREMVGISASDATLRAAFPGRIRPTIHYFELDPTADPEKVAARLETAFVASGLEAESIQEVVDDAVAASLTFNKLIQGFMGLGLLGGVAALGVISARAVVERCQQIGVMRAIVGVIFSSSTPSRSPRRSRRRYAPRVSARPKRSDISNERSFDPSTRRLASRRLARRRPGRRRRVISHDRLLLRDREGLAVV